MKNNQCPAALAKENEALRKQLEAIKSNDDQSGCAEGFVNLVAALMEIRRTVVRSTFALGMLIFLLAVAVSL